MRSPPFSPGPGPYPTTSLNPRMANLISPQNSQPWSFLTNSNFKGAYPINKSVAWHNGRAFTSHAKGKKKVKVYLKPSKGHRARASRVAPVSLTTVNLQARVCNASRGAMWSALRPTAFDIFDRLPRCPIYLVFTEINQFTDPVRLGG